MAIYINDTLRDSQTAVPTANDYGYGLYRAQTNPRWYEPSRTNDFELFISGLEGLTDLRDPSKVIVNAGEIIRYAVIQCPIPHFDIQDIVQRRGNSVVHYAGLPDFQQGNITIRDWIGANTKNILMSWLNLAYNVYTDKTGLLEDYKKQGTLVEYSPDKQIIRSWTVRGLWVAGISEEQFDHTLNSSERTLSATLHYDVAFLNLDDAADEAVLSGNVSGTGMGLTSNTSGNSARPNVRIG